MGSGGKGGSSSTVNPYQAAQADWLFNRPNTYSPTSSTVNTFPGQTPPPSQNVGFLPGQLSGPAQSIFGSSGNLPGYGTPIAPTTPQLPQMPSGPTAQSLPQALAAPINSNNPNAGGGNHAVPNTSLTGGIFPGGIPTTPAATTTVLPPALLALQSGQTTAQANSLADALGRQQAMAGGSLPVLPSNPEAFNKNISDTMYNLGAEPLQRDFGKNLNTLEQSLANRGLAFGGEGASRALSDFGREQSQALSNLAGQSVLAGGAQASRSLGDIEGIRSQQMNELNTLLGLAPVGQNAGAGATNPVDIMGALGLSQQGQQANANRAAQTKGTNTSAAAGLGSAAMMAAKMSDRRFKKEVRCLGALNGVNLYAFRFVDGEEAIGVMADEVPWAAARHNGVAYVNYGRVF